MIISENGKPELTIFQTMMAKTDFLLNDDAAKRENYYEKEVVNLLKMTFIGRLAKLLKEHLLRVVFS